LEALKDDTKLLQVCQPLLSNVRFKSVAISSFKARGTHTRLPLPPPNSQAPLPPPPQMLRETIGAGVLAVTWHFEYFPIRCHSCLHFPLGLARFAGGTRQARGLTGSPIPLTQRQTCGTHPVTDWVGRAPLASLTALPRRRMSNCWLNTSTASPARCFLFVSPPLVCLLASASFLGGGYG
jgi:hypothetical protein